MPLSRRHLIAAGAKVTVADPFVSEFWTRENDATYGNSGPSVKTHAITPELIRGADIVIIATDHTDFPYADIVENAKVVFDTRNATGFRKIISKKVFKLSTPVPVNRA